MNRSTGPGIDAMSGTHRQPSIVSLPGLTTTIRSRANPSRIRLLRMMWPGLSRSDTPMIAAEEGSSSAFSLPIGRGARGGLGPDPSVTRMSRATRRPPAMTSGLISHSEIACGAKADARSMNCRTAATTSPFSIRGSCPRSRPVARRPMASRSIASAISRSVVTPGAKMPISRPGWNAPARNSV
jgi:hypothetical protein